MRSDVFWADRWIVFRVDHRTGLGQSLIAGALCMLLVNQPLLAERLADKSSKPDESVKAGKAERAGASASGEEIKGEQRTLHALNRLTFGPRPGDVEAVDSVGLQRWFEQQLNPAAIDDSALERRLNMFPAMKMQQAELMARYPSPLVLQQMIKTDAPLPSDPMEHVIYADQIAFYKMAQAKKEAIAASSAAGTSGAAEASGAAGAGRITAAGEASQSSESAVRASIDRATPEGNTSNSAGDPQRIDSQRMEPRRIDPRKAGLPAAGDDEDLPARKMHEEQFYSGLEAVKIVNLAPEQRVKRILEMQPQELIGFRKSLSQSELAALLNGLNGAQRETLGALQGSLRLIGGELLQSRLLRDVYSNRQLEAVMTDFWLNHFNVYVKKNQNEPYFLPAYERDAVRPHALGKFEDLLVATAKSPAMLMYLDNWQSVGPNSAAARNGRKFAGAAKNPQVKEALADRGLNENYARELMELHTLGVQCEVSQDHPSTALSPACGRGYTQQDVTQVAEVLSGWTIDRPFRGGEYRFEARRHEPGAKTVLGTSIAENGESEGLEVLHMLATSPATAHFISGKLAVRFVSDTPPQALVDRMARSFVESGGDIKVVLRTMFQSPEFWAPEVVRAKVKTPLEFVVSAVRSSDADVENAASLAQSLARLGMPLYGMQTPNGYSWLADSWVSTGALVSRMNFALVLSGNRLAGTRTDWTQYLGSGDQVVAASVKAVVFGATGAGTDQAGASVAAKEKKLEALLLDQPVSERTRQAVLLQFQDAAVGLAAEKNFTIDSTATERSPDALPSRPVALEEGRVAIVGGDPQLARMAGLLLGSPEFQRR